MVHDFFKTKPIISIDNDDLEPFFTTQGQLLAIDCEEFDLWHEPYKAICEKTKNELDSLDENYKIRRVLFLFFQPTGHELKMNDMESLRLMSSSFETAIWGIGTWHEDSARLLSLVEITPTFPSCLNNEKCNKCNNSKKQAFSNGSIKLQ